MGVRKRKKSMTPEVRDQICTLLKAGTTISAAAQVVGITRKTIHIWLQKGQEEERGRYREFYLDAEAARGHAEALCVARIVAASKDDWRAAAWYLARARKKGWGDSMEITAEITADVTTKGSPDLTLLSDSQLETFLTLLTVATTSDDDEGSV